MNLQLMNNAFTEKLQVLFARTKTFKELLIKQKWVCRGLLTLRYPKVGYQKVGNNYLVVTKNKTLNFLKINSANVFIHVFSPG